MSKRKFIKLYEEFTESKNYKIREFFDRLIVDVNKWFEEGSLSSQEATLIDIEQSNEEMGMTRNLKFDFEDKEFRYQVVIIIDHTMFDGNNLDKCYLTVKKYIFDEPTVLGIIEEEGLSITNLTEDYIISKIAEIDGEKTAIEETELDKQNNFQTQLEEPEETTGEEETETPEEETPEEETPEEETPEGGF